MTRIEVSTLPAPPGIEKEPPPPPPAFADGLPGAGAGHGPGSAVTVTVRRCVDEAPQPLVAVMVYSVVAAGAEMSTKPVCGNPPPTPGEMETVTPVPEGSLICQASLTSPPSPCVTEDGL